MLAPRRISAYLSEPTQPMKRTEEGGRMYCFCAEKEETKSVSRMDQIRGLGFFELEKEGGGVGDWWERGFCILEHHGRCFGLLHQRSVWHRNCGGVRRRGPCASPRREQNRWP